MSDGLSSEQVERYNRDGVLFPMTALSSSEVSRYLSALEEVEARTGANQQALRMSHLYFRWAYDLATQPGIIDKVASILGPEVIIWGTLILSKPPNSTAYTSWHQDSAYAGLGASNATSVWVALSDSTPESGCLRVVPGSHNRMLPHEQILSEDNLLRQGQHVKVKINETEAVDVSLKAGEMSLHHFNIIHGSNPNRSGSRRTGFIIRFVTPTMSKPPFPVVRARGSAECAHLDLLENLPSEDIEEGLASLSKDGWLTGGKVG